jgi:hypothetical protein
MKAAKTIANGGQGSKGGTWRWHPLTPAALLMVLAATLGLSACAVRPWADKWDIYYASDSDPKEMPGGGAVIWKPGATNSFELQTSSVHLAGVEVYQSTVREFMTPYWDHVQFIRLGSRPLRAPRLKDHPLPLKLVGGSYEKQAVSELEPIVNSVLTGMVQANTERLVGSFVKDNRVEYFILYRLRDALVDEGRRKDLLIIDLKDPKAEAVKYGGGARENGWGTGGRH